MDKTKLSIALVLGALALYAGYRYYQSKTATNGNDQLPAQSEMAYYSTPPTVSASGSPGQVYVHGGTVSQTITQQQGKPVYNSGQSINYPMV